ncbi:MAG: FHA domain-containing protein [Phycisphaerales bacterium]|nr:FHA domain-containing protein [Phycisphaerae bacterium]NNF42696.1 FHA domain-containing protein [Phycisphaerales bacterium]NNM26818.1 FHA domain-containing protein [Phycisphaerales bacterium]
MLELHICNRSGSVLRSFALGDTSEVIVGRDDSCDIQIRSKAVSREHCLIEQQGQDVFLRDLDSAGGTYVSGKKVDAVRLEDGMQAVVGPAVLKFIDNDIE